MHPSDYGPFRYVPITDRPRLVWPNGARLALWVVPNLEWFSLQRAQPSRPWEKAGAATPTVRAWGQRDYGNRVGIFRIMSVLDRYGIRATASTNADICDHHPQIIEAAMKRGWELMGHNRTNNVRLTQVPADQERDLIHYCLERLERATGKKVLGWLGAGLDETWNTLDYLAEEGVLYVSDWVNDDQPYLMQVNGRRLVYVPYSYEINDSPQLYYFYRDAEDFERMIRRQFDTLYAEGAESGRVMAICLHPFIIGQPHLIGILDSALKYICAHSGVWCATGEEIMRAYLASGVAF